MHEKSKKKWNFYENKTDSPLLLQMESHGMDLDMLGSAVASSGMTVSEIFVGERNFYSSIFHRHPHSIVLVHLQKKLSYWITKPLCNRPAHLDDMNHLTIHMIIYAKYIILYSPLCKRLDYSNDPDHICKQLWYLTVLFAIYK